MTTPRKLNGSNKYYFIKRVKGKLIRKTTGTDNLKKAKEICRDWDNEYETFNTAAPLPNHISIEHALKEYKENKKTQLTERSFKLLCLRLDDFCEKIKPAYHLSDLTPGVIQNFLNAQTGRKYFPYQKDGIPDRSRPKTLSLHTVKQYRRYIVGFCEWLCFYDKIAKNPAKKTTTKKPPQFKIKFLSFIEKQAATEGVKGKNVETAVMLTLNAGARISEALAIEWEDFNFELRTVGFFNKPYHILKDKQERIVPMNQELYDYLIKLRETLKNPTGRVCLYCGKPYYKIPYKALKTLSRRIGVHLSWHIFRKTFASHHIINGTSIIKVSRWLGHSTPAITAEHYADLLAQYDKDIENANRVTSITPVEQLQTVSY